MAYFKMIIYGLLQEEEKRNRAASEDGCSCRPCGIP